MTGSPGPPSSPVPRPTNRPPAPGPFPTGQLQLAVVPIEAPVAAALATIVGGALILVAAAAQARWAYSTGLGLSLTGIPAEFYGELGTLVGFAIAVLGGAIWFTRVPRTRRLSGVAAFLLSLLSLAFGAGFLIGLALAVAGGLWAFSWKPGPAYMVVPSGPHRCPWCGFTSDLPRRRCPHCHEPLR